MGHDTFPGLKDVDIYSETISCILFWESALPSFLSQICRYKESFHTQNIVFGVQSICSRHSSLLKDVSDECLRLKIRAFVSKDSLDQLIQGKYDGSDE